MALDWHRLTTTLAQDEEQDIEPPSLVPRYDSNTDDNNTVFNQIPNDKAPKIRLQSTNNEAWHSQTNTRSPSTPLTTPQTLQPTIARQSTRRVMADIPNLVPTQIPILHQRAQPIHLEGLLPAQNQAVHKNFYTGDTLQLPKPTSTMGVYFQNVNGINLTSTGNWDVICEHLQDMEVDIALLAKHKLDTNQPWVNQKLRDMARAVFGLGSFSIMAATTPVESPTMYKPGGVLSLINGNVKGRMLSADKDPLGGWVYTSLGQNTGPPLTIVTTYQVVDVNPRQAGPTTYATQLYATYLQEGRQHPENLCSHHAHDLLTFVKQCQA